MSSRVRDGGGGYGVGAGPHVESKEADVGDRAPQSAELLLDKTFLFMHRADVGPARSVLSRKSVDGQLGFGREFRSVHPGRYHTNSKAVDVAIWEGLSQLDDAESFLRQLGFSKEAITDMPRALREYDEAMKAVASGGGYPEDVVPEDQQPHIVEQLELVKAEGSETERAAFVQSYLAGFVKKALPHIAWLKQQESLTPWAREDTLSQSDGAASYWTQRQHMCNAFANPMVIRIHSEVMGDQSLAEDYFGFPRAAENMAAIVGYLYAFRLQQDSDAPISTKTAAFMAYLCQEVDASGCNAMLLLKKDGLEAALNSAHFDSLYGEVCDYLRANLPEQPRQPVEFQVWQSSLAAVFDATNEIDEAELVQAQRQSVHGYLTGKSLLNNIIDRMSSGSGIALVAEDDNMVAVVIADLVAAHFKAQYDPEHFAGPTEGQLAALLSTYLLDDANQLRVERFQKLMGSLQMAYQLTAKPTGLVDHDQLKASNCDLVFELLAADPAIAAQIGDEQLAQIQAVDPSVKRAEKAFAEAKLAADMMSKKRDDGHPLVSPEVRYRLPRLRQIQDFFASAGKASRLNQDTVTDLNNKELPISKLLLANLEHAEVRSKLLNSEVVLPAIALQLFTGAGEAQQQQLKGLLYEWVRQPPAEDGELAVNQSRVDILLKALALTGAGADQQAGRVALLQAALVGNNPGADAVAVLFPANVHTFLAENIMARFAAAELGWELTPAQVVDSVINVDDEASIDHVASLTRAWDQVRDNESLGEVHINRLQAQAQARFYQAGSIGQMVVAVQQRLYFAKVLDMMAGTTEAMSVVRTHFTEKFLSYGTGDADQKAKELVALAQVLGEERRMRTLFAARLSNLRTASADDFCITHRNAMALAHAMDESFPQVDGEEPYVSQVNNVVQEQGRQFEAMLPQQGPEEDSSLAERFVDAALDTESMNDGVFTLLLESGLMFGRQDFIDTLRKQVGLKAPQIQRKIVEADKMRKTAVHFLIGFGFACPLLWIPAIICAVVGNKLHAKYQKQQVRLGDIQDKVSPEVADGARPVRGDGAATPPPSVGVRAPAGSLRSGAGGDGLDAPLLPRTRAKRAVSCSQTRGGSLLQREAEDVSTEEEQAVLLCP
jgi:hypothetical protein